MKVLSITGSRRTDGNTARIVTLLEDRLREMAAGRGIPLLVERVALGPLDIGVCRGCRLCFDRGEDRCPLRDDALSVRDRMLEADGILVASPVYVEDVSGLTKNWIDRTAFLCHRPVLHGKCVFAVTTSGIGSSGHTIRTLSSAFNTWGARMVGSARFRTGALMSAQDMEKIHAKGLDRAARQFFRALTGPFAPSFYSLIAFTVQQRCWLAGSADRDSLDYRYWQDRGWLEKGCTYPIAHRGGWLRIGLARGLGRVIALFFV